MIQFHTSCGITSAYKWLYHSQTDLYILFSRRLALVVFDNIAYFDHAANVYGFLETDSKEVALALLEYYIHKTTTPTLKQINLLSQQMVR